MLAGLLCTLLIAQGGSVRDAGRVEPGAAWSMPIAASPRERWLSVVVSLDQPGHLTPGQAVQSTVTLGDITLTKPLHTGDPDVTWTVRQPAGQGGSIALQAPEGLKAPAAFVVGVVELDDAGENAVRFEVEPNDTPERANRLTLGQTVYGLADDRPEFPLGAAPTDAEQTAGIDWFRFDYDGETPTLAYFGLEFVDRDIPPDVRVFQLKDGQPVEYTQGIDPQSLQREKPPRPGANKFTTRVLTKGTYYLQVDAAHPEYQLRTRLLPVPPYLKSDDAAPDAVASAARQAVRTAMPFQLGSGESWHANTPRRGHPTDRIANPHHETSTCIACHPTHFTTQSVVEAIGNGYAVNEPYALQFLTERLANNPVPFPGHEGAVWARMIPAPANVLGRLSTIVMDAEDRLGQPHHDVLHGEIAAFLKLYYEGRDTIAPDESNGNNPISRYKVAADAYRQLDTLQKRTGEKRFEPTRDLIGQLINTGELSNTRDLAAQTIGLCRIDRQKHAERIAANCQRLLELQRSDGHWSVKFEADYPITEMQTGESLYALALAGYTTEHPAVRRGVLALLKSQDEFGGWLDPNPYEPFRTPYRETQWAIMALSRLYPETNGRQGRTGWDGPLGPQVARLRTDSAGTLIRDLETIWDPIDTSLSAEVVRAAQHELPLVRLAACATLGRVGDRTAVATLIGRLGDETKPVRRAAAEALRRIGNRLNAATGPSQTLDQVHFITALEAALESTDDRTRRGATRLFAAHFRDLSRETDLADALLKRLDDVDPVVAMQAIKGLWRWWYWTSDTALRERIEDAFLAHQAHPTHPWVRRNLTEALYILADENIRYLYNHWTPSLPKEADRDAVAEAQHATVNRLARKLVAAIDSGNPLARDGALRALSEFHERPAVREGRVGNDTEPTLFYDEAVPLVASALVRALDDPDATVRRLALQGLITVRGSKDAALGRAVLGRRGDPDASVREWAGLQLKEFPVAVEASRADPALDAVLATLLKSESAEGRAAAVAVLGRWGAVEGTEHTAQVRQALSDADPAVRAEAFTALARFDTLRAEPGIARRVAQALADPGVAPRLAALRLALASRNLVPEKALKAALEDTAPNHRGALLEAIAANKAYATDLRLVGVVADALADADRGVRERALQALQAHPTLVPNPAVAEALRTLAGTDNARQREIATTLLKSQGQSSGAGGASAEGLDLAFFQAKVLPVLAQAGEDGQSCVGCHRSHTIFRLAGPEGDAGWTAERVRTNYRSALRVVNPVNPSASLLLLKPTWEAGEEAEAQHDPTKQAHSGGVRFEADSDAYRVLLDWINGARLKPTTAAAGGGN